MSHHDHTSIPPDSVQGLTRPVYCPATWRDYVPPPIFTQVRAPVPLPRSDLKDQGPRTAPPPPARPSGGAVPPTHWGARGGDWQAEHLRGPALADRVRALLADLPPGASLTLVALRQRLPAYLNTHTLRTTLVRLRQAGAAESRVLLMHDGPNHSGRITEWRRTQPGVPWGAPPPGTRLPGQRPPLRPTHRREA